MMAALSAGSAARKIVAQGDYLRQLDQSLNAIWKLGRNLIVGWRPAPHGIDLLMATYLKFNRDSTKVGSKVELP